MKSDEYITQYSKSARKFLKSQDAKTQAQIVEAIDKLPWSGDIATIGGTKDTFRLRVRTFRILYRVDHGKLIVMVIDIDNRGDAYK